MSAEPEHPSTAPSPLRVAVAIAAFFPYGFYLLWKHPTLGKKPRWWIGGVAYVVFALFVLGERSIDTKAMRSIAEATLPIVYGDFEMKWGKDFLAGRDPSDAWGGTAELPNGKPVFVSFFPRKGDFVWLSSPSDGGIYAAGYNDTKYWDSKGERITDEKEFWKRAGYQLDDVMEKSKSMARLNRSLEQQRKQRNLERLQRAFDEEVKKSKYK